MGKPRIGLTLDRMDQDVPFYALREPYIEAVLQSGGVPLGIPYSIDDIPTYIESLDGFIITGGGFDPDPRLYGEDIRYDSVKLKPERTAFEWALTEAILASQKPFLGICGGMQLLNIVRGGTLFQDIPSDCKDTFEHSQKHSARQAQHVVTINKSSRLFEWCGTSTFEVNSSHHQAVKGLGQGLFINARASDGITEGIEDPTLPFCLGVQWHPEYQIGPEDKGILGSFVQACGS